MLGSNAILTNTGKQELANVFRSFEYWLAWGSGDPSWDSTMQAESPLDTALVNEIGRRKAVITEYCTPDNTNGTIEIVNGSTTQRFSPSATPTYHIHIRFEFQLTDSPEATIRECGVFAHTVLKDDVPDPDGYVTPEYIEDIGSLIMEERLRPAVVLQDSTKRAFDFVISI